MPNSHHGRNPTVPSFSCEPAGAQGFHAGFALRDGDRVVFYGDSITQDGGYARLVEAYARTRFPHWRLRFYNAGVGGDTVWGGRAGDIGVRLQRDVIALQPTVVTVMLGMNDGGYRPAEPATMARFAEGYRALASALRQALSDTRIFFICTSPFDDISRPPATDPGYNEVIRRLSDFVRELGREMNISVIDFGCRVEEGIQSVVAVNPALAKQLIPDRLHPGLAAHLLMGATLLRAWCAPDLVTRVEIDARFRRVAVAENAGVSGLAFNNGEIAWQELDHALPLPVNFGENANTLLADQAGADLASLGRQPLVITGLNTGKYELQIDGESIGAFSEDAWSRGIDLGVLPTPMVWQSVAVFWDAERSHAVHRMRRDLVVTPGGPLDTQSATALLAERDEILQAARGAMVVPVSRRFLVRRLPGLRFS
jgi:lysophospholipase L1-like esterase